MLSFYFLYSPVKIFTGNLAVVCDMSSCVLFEFTFFLYTFGRSMCSFVLEKSPVARNAFFCTFKSVFQHRSSRPPSDPTHPIRRVLPAQKKGTHKKF